MIMTIKLLIKMAMKVDIDKADEWLNTPVPNENLQP
jgi:hypothetical protein